MQNNSNHHLNNIKRLLEEERQIILDGSYDDFELFSKKKIDAFKRIQFHSVHFQETEIKSVEEMLHRNQSLFEASRLGMKAGIERILEIRRVVDSLQTYNEDGEINSSTTQASTISVKA